MAINLSPCAWPKLPPLPEPGALGRLDVGTADDLMAAVAWAVPSEQVVIAKDIDALGATLVYGTMGTDTAPVVLRGASTSTDPCQWPELARCTLHVLGDRLVVFRLRLNDCRIILGSAAQTSARYFGNRISRCWHYGGDGAGRREAAIIIGTGCRGVKVDRCTFAPWGAIGMARHGIIGDMAGAVTKVIASILPTGATARTAIAAVPQPGSIVAPTPDQISQDLQIERCLFQGLGGGAYAMFLGQDNGESEIPANWNVHHCLFRDLAGNGDRPWIEVKNSDSAFHDNTFERTTTEARRGHLRLRHGERNRVERNLFLARGAWKTGDIQVRDQGHAIVNNQSWQTVKGELVQGADRVSLSSGGLDCNLWPTRSGEATGESSWQINSAACLVGGNRLRIEYGGCEIEAESTCGVPCRDHRIGPEGGQLPSRNWRVGPASGAAFGTHFIDLDLAAEVPGADYAGTALAPLIETDAGVMVP